MSHIPRTDSIEELARFWDSHDLTDFEDELEVVEEPVFERRIRTIVHVPLDSNQAATLHHLAEARGIEDAVLIREWVSEKLAAQ